MATDIKKERIIAYIGQRASTNAQISVLAGMFQCLAEPREYHLSKSIMECNNVAVIETANNIIHVWYKEWEDQYGYGRIDAAMCEKITQNKE